MRLSEFFRNAGTKQIVINTDIDGFLSGMILQEYYGCEIVGFSNSKESIWLKPGIDIRSPIYIDIFVRDPNVYCIDQHIVAYDRPHLERISAYGTKLNPNLDLNKRTFIGDLGNDADYYHKYPFGTVHYLIALMNDDGIDVVFHNLTMGWNVPGKNKKNYNTCPAQIILRADDALTSSLGKYRDNAGIWWEHLRGFQSTTIENLIQYLRECKSDKALVYKDYMTDFFINGLGCDGADGSFERITNDDNRLKNDILRYNEFINKIVGICMNLPTEVVEHKGIQSICDYSLEKEKKAFTYAFVCGPQKRDRCFSYTADFI